MLVTTPMQPSEPRTSNILKANTDQPLVPDPDYSDLKLAPAPAVWIATAIEKVINAVLWILDTLSQGL